MDGKTVREVGGICWDVCPWMPGAADLSASPSLAKVKVAFSGLAAFHQAMGPLREEPFCPGLAARSRELKTLLSGELHSWRRAVLHHQADPAQQLALRWLNLAELIAPRLEPEMAHLASLPTPVQPVIRDVRPEHLLFTDDRLTGLVDFGAMEIDTVSADLARLLSEWLGSDRFLRAEALTAYVRVRCLDSVELRLIDAFERSAALLGGGRWVQWHFVERIPFEDTSAVQRGLERGVERIERLITR
jgi:homoserine kinase type II